jgi:hypoxanthine-DNA glycosylase
VSKYKFTKTQFDEICLLLRRRPSEGRDQQKETRARIRKLGFMISDYFNGFSDLDFEKLLDKGEIEITTRQNSVTTPPVKKTITKQVISTTKTNISKKALPPVIDKNTEYLVLGTMPGEKSLLNQEYYNNPSNQFWNIIASAFNNGDEFSNYNEKLESIKKNKIGLWDVLDTCEREGSLDSNIKNQTPNNFGKLFKEFSNIKTVIFNGQDSYSYFNSLVHDKADKIYLQLTSTSSANTHKTVDEKSQQWKAALTKNSR